MNGDGITRRGATAQILAGGVALGLPQLALGQVGESRVVTTTGGRVRGLQNGKIAAFWGIPFGADTSKRRFQPALKAPNWTGVRACIKAGAQAPQMDLFQLPPTQGASPALQAVMTIFNAGTPKDMSESEDCLFLNVFTPDASTARKRPVMFWLHGGGFASGTGGIASYDGSALCRRGDVVVVTINSRLNAMGYLYLGALHDDFADSGNVGQLDQILALQWVKDNIAAFGGDPNNVTIFGESGGGSKVSCLLAMPPAKGLFHKGIVQSGPAVRLGDKDRAAALAELTLAKLGVAKADVHKLQTMPYKAVIDAVAAVQAANPRARYTLGPVVDGRSLPRHPFDPVAPDVSRQVPMMIGTNKDEATLFAVMQPKFGQWTTEDAHARFQAALGAKADEGYAVFTRLRPDYSPTHLVTALTTAQGTWINSIRQAERKVAQNAAATYMYRLDWETPILGGLFKSPHGLDVGLVFDNVEKSAGGFMGDGPEPAKLAAEMSQAWINFARSGDPSQKGLAWPRYENSKRATMIFAANSHVVPDPDKSAREFATANSPVA